MIKKITKQLSEIYTENESISMAREIVCFITNRSLTSLLADGEINLNEKENQQVDIIIKRLLQHEPLQYIIGSTTFFNRTFNCDSRALIPRPETEELIEWILSDLQTSQTKDIINILDIGTGSGCIAITLSLEIKNAIVTAIDISKDAIELATINNKKLDAAVEFIERDILQSDIESTTTSAHNTYDIIVSNPPYITISEQESMEKNVVKYEPSLALFVPDNSPLLFYQAIAQYGLTHLKKDGKIYFEINQRYGSETVQMMQNLGYKNVELHSDINNNERMVKAEL